MGRGRKPNSAKVLDYNTIFYNSVGSYVQKINNYLSSKISLEPLSKYIKIAGGFAFKSSDYSNRGIPVIRISDFSDEKITLEKVKFYNESKALKRYELNQGDIIIALTGGTIAKLGIVQDGIGKLYLNQRVGKFEVLDSALFESEYVYWIARSVQVAIKKLAWGAAIPNVSPKQIEKLKFPIPEKKIQRGIISFLNDMKNNSLVMGKCYFHAETENEIILMHKCSLYSAGIVTELTHQQTLLKKLRQQILQEAIEGKLTEDLPRRQAGWRDTSFLNYSNKWVPEQSESYFSYVLECEDGSLYKGFTQNLFDRINRHLDGRGAKKTQQSKPIYLIHFEEFSTQREAVEREKYFKSGSGREWLKRIHKERVKENEPASELLKRIQAAKAQLTCPSGRRVKDKKIRKQKPLLPIREEEKPFALPEGWVWCRLGEVVNAYEAGKSFKCIDRLVSNDEWGILKTSAVTSASYIEREHKFFQSNTPDDVSKRVKSGDLIFCRASGSKRLAGKCCLVKGVQKNLLLSDKTPRLKLSSLMEKMYVFFHNETKHTKTYYSGLNTGKSTSMNNITKDQLFEKPLPLPPIDEQKAIVTKVEKLLAVCDQLETQITHNQNHANALMQAVLKEAFLP